jgi:hypothetical protein
LVEVAVVNRFPIMETRVEGKQGKLELAGIISGEQVRSYALK